jgi:hypothetical protein
MVLFLGPNGQTYGPLLDDNTLKQMQADGAMNKTPVSRPLGLLFNPDGSYPTDKPLSQTQAQPKILTAMPKSQGITSIARPVVQPQAITQKQSMIRHPDKYKQILAGVQKKKTMAKGGRVGYADGSQPQISQQQVAMAITMLKKGADMDTISSVTGIPPQMIQAVISKLQQGIQQQAPGGIAGYKTGGIPEIDYRDKGGYVPPIGKKERADDIPAMLSNNEFVFTANAVRNAGGGDVKHGAKKMYALMKKLEGKV